MLKVIGCLLLMCCIPSAIAGQGAHFIAADRLVQAKQRLLGSKVSTHGCLVVSRHGEFLRPCGSTGSQIILIRDPQFLVLDAFHTVGVNLSKQVEATVTGTIVEGYEQHLVPHKAIYLQLQSVSGARKHEP
jgi:hypothetical protein